MKNLIEIDSRIIDFLKYMYFRNIDDSYVAAANRAYRDMNRTIRFRQKERVKEICYVRRQRI